MNRKCLLQIRKYLRKHISKQNRSLQKFLNIRRNIFPNSEAGFSFSKRLYASVSLGYWNYFFFRRLVHRRVYERQVSKECLQLQKFKEIFTPFRGIQLILFLLVEMN